MSWLSHAARGSVSTCALAAGAKPAAPAVEAGFGRMGTILDQVASTVDDADAKNADGERGDAEERRLWRRRSCG